MMSRYDNIHGDEHLITEDCLTEDQIEAWEDMLVDQWCDEGCPD